mgnify:FL=1
MYYVYISHVIYYEHVEQETSTSQQLEESTLYSFISVYVSLLYPKDSFNEKHFNRGNHTAQRRFSTQLSRDQLNLIKIFYTIPSSNILLQ